MTRDEEIRRAAGNVAIRDNKLQDYWQYVRERSAIAAMQGMISNGRYIGSTNMVAETAVRFADALIEELKKK